MEVTLDEANRLCDALEQPESPGAAQCIAWIFAHCLGIPFADLPQTVWRIKVNNSGNNKPIKKIGIVRNGSADVHVLANPQMLRTAASMIRDTHPRAAPARPMGSGWTAVLDGTVRDTVTIVFNLPSAPPRLPAVEDIKYVQRAVADARDKLQGIARAWDAYGALPADQATSLWPMVVLSIIPVYGAFELVQRVLYNRFQPYRDGLWRTNDIHDYHQYVSSMDRYREQWGLPVPPPAPPGGVDDMLAHIADLEAYIARKMDVMESMVAPARDARLADLHQTVSWQLNSLNALAAARETAPVTLSRPLQIGPDLGHVHRVTLVWPHPTPDLPRLLSIFYAVRCLLSHSGNVDPDADLQALHAVVNVPYSRGVDRTAQHDRLMAAVEDAVRLEQGSGLTARVLRAIQGGGGEAGDRVTAALDMADLESIRQGVSQILAIYSEFLEDALSLHRRQERQAAVMEFIAGRVAL